MVAPLFFAWLLSQSRHMAHRGRIKPLITLSDSRLLIQSIIGATKNRQLLDPAVFSSDSIPLPHVS